MTWQDVVPFPGNPIYEGRLANMRRQWGGYDHRIVGSPAIFDNSAGAFPELPPDARLIGDGNHRYALAERDGKLGEEFIAEVYRSLSRAEMYRVRRGLNDRRTVKPAERFLALCEEGVRPDLEALKNAVEGLGWRITYQREPGGLPCPNELELIWRHSKGALVRAIQTYEGVWGQKDERSQARVVKGLGAFWIKYPDADMDRLVASLKKGARGGSRVAVDELYQAGRNQYEELPFIASVVDGIRYVLAMTYNKGKQSGRLAL